jgi:hypothetical protein
MAGEARKMRKVAGSPKVGISCEGLLVRALTCMVAMVVGFAASAKVVGFHDFRVALEGMGLNSSGASILATGVLAAEATICFTLIVNQLQTAALLACLSLNATFIGYSAFRLYGHTVSPCKCFGALVAMSPSVTLALNAILIVSA